MGTTGCYLKVDTLGTRLVITTFSETDFGSFKKFYPKSSDGYMFPIFKRGAHSQPKVIHDTLCKKMRGA